MYIKAEKVINHHDGQGGSNELRSPIDGIESKSTPNLMERRVQANHISSINSLNFLHRPQRVSHMRASLFPDEEIVKNTNLNKKLSSANNGVVESSFSPTKGNGFFDGSIHASEEQLPFSPVYKKSGELVKSSLKRRSKSLPTSPHINNENKNLSNVRPGGRLQRSKSVHFDQKTPVKYFCEDESPIDVSTRTDEKCEEISFQHKPVKSIFDDEDEDEDEGVLSMGIDRLRLKTEDPSKTAQKKLRKSKRFNDFLKSQNSSTTKVNTNNVLLRPNLPSRSNSTQNVINNTNGNSNNRINTRVVGLYNVNFPILSNKNPKSLKLNIFINLSRDKKCFLQDLTLYTQRGLSNSNSSNNINTNNNNHNNLQSNNSNNLHTNTNVTRLIIGRVLVKNIFYDKKVVIKYTWDNWRTAHEVECVYVSDGDGILPGTNMDIFNFIIDDVSKQDRKAKLEFCIHYIARNDYQRLEYWDNNDGKNYKIDCIMDGFHNPFATTTT